MKALAIDAGIPVLREIPDPAVTQPDDVLIGVKATGVCGTDLLILTGRYPSRDGVVLGHESTGVVLGVGREVRRVAPGDRVVLDPTYHCSACFCCRTGRPNYCEDKATTETGVSKDGTFADLHVARESFVYKLPDELTYEEGTLTEPLACVLHGLSHTRLRLDSRVLVVGAGPIGLLFAGAMAASGHEVGIAEIDSYRQSLARTVVPGISIVDTGRSASRRFDLIVDTSGRALEMALPLVERGGEVLLAGLDYTVEARIRPAYLTDNGIRLIGSIDTDRTFEPALSLLRRVPTLRKIVTHCLPLARFAEALRLLGYADPGTRSAIGAGKVVLAP